jgi:hypothetical protein
MAERKKKQAGIAALGVTFVALVVAALTGWYTPAPYSFFGYFFLGWFVYIVVGLVALTLAIVALATGERRAIPILCIVVLLLGGPATCTGSLVWKGHCEEHGAARATDGPPLCW